MKRKLLLFIVFIYGIGLSSIHAIDFKDCVCFQGFWTEWYPVRMDVYGGYGGMTFRPRNSDPWLYHFGFSIENFVFPTKQQIKEHVKNNIEYIYTGTCEYYVCDEYPTITEIIKKFKRPLAIHPEGEKSKKYYTNIRKVTERVTIAIAPFHDVPNNYTIVLGDVKYAFYFPTGIYFNQ